MAKKKKTTQRVVPRWLVIVGVLGLLAIAGGLVYRIVAPIQEGQRLVAEATALAEDPSEASDLADTAETAPPRGGGGILANAASALGVSEADLNAALGDTRPIDYDAASEALGLPAAEIEAAIQNNRPGATTAQGNNAQPQQGAQGGNGGGGGGGGGREAMIAGAAAELGISEADLAAAFGEGRPDVEAAAATLGIPAADLQAAIQNNRPAGGGGGGQGQGQGQAQAEQSTGAQVWDAVLSLNPFAATDDDAVVDPTALVYAEVVTLNATETVEGSGTLTPKQTDSVTWGTTGRIGEVLVQVGDVVAKGQVLMTVDPESYADSIINAENALLNAQIALADLLEDADPLDVVRAREAVVLAEDALTDAQDTLANLGYVDHDYYADLIADAQNVVTDAIETREAALADVESAQRNIATVQLQAEGLALDAEKAQRSLESTILSAEQEAALVELGSLVDALNVAESELTYTQEQHGNAQVAHNDNCLKRAEDETLPACRTTDAVHLGRSLDQWTQSVLDVQRKVDKAALDLEVARQKNQQLYDDAAFTARENAASVAENANANTNALLDAQANLSTQQSDVANAEDAIADAQTTVAELEAEYAIAQSEPPSRDVELAQLAVDVAAAELVSAQTAYADLLAGADEIEIAQAEANIRAAAATLEKLNLKAPYDSTIMEVNYLPGSNISTSNTAVQVADLDTLLITLAVDETDISQMQLGQVATLTFDAILNETFTGEVTAIAPFGQDDGGIIRYDVEIELRDEDPRLLVGMTTNARIITNELENVLAVSLDAVLLDEQGEYVLALNPRTGAHDRVGIVTGIIEGSFIVVQQGDLRPGQQLLIEDPVATTTGAPNVGGGGLLGGLGRGGGGGGGGAGGGGGGGR